MKHLFYKQSDHFIIFKFLYTDNPLLDSVYSKLANCTIVNNFNLRPKIVQIIYKNLLKNNIV